MSNKGLFKNFKGKFKIIILHPETYEERAGFHTSKLKLTIIASIIVILIVAATASLVVFTPIRELIPGYTDVSLNRRIYQIERSTDSIELVLKQKDLYLNNLRRIIYEEEMDDDSIAATSLINKGVTVAKDKKTENDSLFRAKYEAELRKSLIGSDGNSNGENDRPIFLSPVTGTITTHFDTNSKHYGVDLVSSSNTTTNAIADGTVILSEWTEEKGYIIGIQHANNIISIYKHNASLLHYEGDNVNAGDAIAIIGGKGSKPHGSHLHLELWCNGTPLNPEDYISFDVK